MQHGAAASGRPQKSSNNRDEFGADSSRFSILSQRHGWRDLSPGASANSAMRPPFNATQEFAVTGYLSV